MASWVLDLERAYVAAAMANGRHRVGTDPQALAAAGAVASRYLAVGTPRSFAIVGDDGSLSLEAHRTWFDPRDLRCTSPVMAAAIGGRVVTLAEALAADIVCVHAPLALSAAQLRRGTHVNALAPVTLDPELRVLATCVDEDGLAAMAAGLVDGRQLDEMTVFLASV